MSKIVYDKDCNNYPSLPTILPFPKNNRIIAIGDVHGDMQLVVDSLIIAKVIFPIKSKLDSISVKVGNNKQNYEWIGGETIVVQIGDQNDSCRPQSGNCDHMKNDTPDDINIFRFYNDLNKLAIKKGGAVYSLLGNHEIMNVSGDFKYTSNANVNMFKKYNDPIDRKKYTGKTFDDAVKHREIAFDTGKEYANLLACTRQSVLIIGEFLFIHAGITKFVLKENNFPGREDLPRLNELVKNWLLQKLDKMDDHMMNELLNSADNSPFWTRIFGSLPPKLSYNDQECKTHLQPILEAYGIKGMIIGHTPQVEHGINSTCGNRIFRIDIGASKAFETKRAPQVLEIEKLSDDNYKYTVIFQKDEVYNAIVPNDIKSFERLETRLPN
jgi:hypothetical protein